MGGRKSRLAGANHILHISKRLSKGFSSGSSNGNHIDNNGDSEDRMLSVRPQTIGATNSSQRRSGDPIYPEDPRPHSFNIAREDSTVSDTLSEIVGEEPDGFGKFGGSVRLVRKSPNRSSGKSHQKKSSRRLHKSDANRYSWKRGDAKPDLEMDSGTFTEVIGKDMETLNVSGDQRHDGKKGRNSDGISEKDHKKKSRKKVGKMKKLSTLSDIVGDEPRSFKKYRGSSALQPIHSLNLDVNATPSLTDIIGQEPDDFTKHAGAKGTNPRISDISFMSVDLGLDSKSLKVEEQLSKFLREKESPANYDREYANMLDYYKNHGEEKLFILLHARYPDAESLKDEVEPLQPIEKVQNLGGIAVLSSAENVSNTENNKVNDKASNRNTFVDQRKAKHNSTEINIERYDKDLRSSSASLIARNEKTKSHKRNHKSKPNNNSKRSTERLPAFPPPVVPAFPPPPDNITNVEIESLMNTADKGTNRNTFVDQRKSKKGNAKISIESYDKDVRTSSAGLMVNDQHNVKVDKSSSKTKRETLEKDRSRKEKKRETLEKHSSRKEKKRETLEKHTSRKEKKRETLEKHSSRKAKKRETLEKHKSRNEKHNSRKHRMHISNHNEKPQSAPENIRDSNDSFPSDIVEKHRSRKGKKKTLVKKRRTNRQKEKPHSAPSSVQYSDDNFPVERPKTVRAKLKEIGVNLKSKSMAIAFSKIRELESERETMLGVDGPPLIHFIVQKNPLSCDSFQQDMRSPRTECLICGLRRLEHM